MTLSEFMKADSLDAAELAARLKVSPEAVRKWLRGERIPRPAQMAAILEVSGGRVGAASFYASPVKPEQPSEAA
jgi:transcriptional regulator with XRE-family HTH domain